MTVVGSVIPNSPHFSPVNHPALEYFLRIDFQDSHRYNGVLS